MEIKFKNFIFTEAQVIKGEADMKIKEAIGWADIKSIQSISFVRDSFNKEQCFLFTVIYQEMEPDD